MSSVIVTAETREQLRREVEPYAWRSYDLPSPGTTFTLPQVGEARAAFDALSIDERARIEGIERALAAHADAERATREASEVREARRRRLRAAGADVTDDVERALVRDELRDTAAIQAARRWCRSRGRAWLMLAGPVGCGKTVAAADTVAFGPDGSMWLRADALCRVFSSSYSEQQTQQQRARTVELLVIDDLGCENDPARMLGVLLDLLDHRKSAHRRPTIVTSNLTRRALQERYPDTRLASRLVESVEWIGLVGSDLRREVSP